MNDENNLQFRPLSQGLGFDKSVGKPLDQKLHRKVVETPKTVDQKFVLEKTEFKIPDKDFETSDHEVPNPTPVSRSLKKMLDSLPPSFDFKEDKKTK